VGRGVSNKGRSPERGRRVNIVHLLAPAPAGGLERVVQGLAIGQRSRGHNVVVAAVVHESLRTHSFLPPLERAGVMVREILVPHRGYGRERAAVVALCREFNADVVHGHGYRPDVVDSDAIRGAGIATVATNHGPTRGSLRNRLYEFLHFRILRRFDAVIAVSQPIRDMLVSSGVQPSRVHVVPNAWNELTPPLTREDARSLLGLPGDARVLGWIGRMSREKGIDVFIDALRVMPDNDVIGCIIGDGRERAREEPRSMRDPGPQRAKWLGMIPEAGRLCRAFDLFVLSSRTEGIPIALLEAIASGTPLVATRVGGVPDVIGDNEAWLVPPERPDILAATITEALAHPETARAKATAAEARLHREFARDKWLDRHDEVYDAARRVRQATL
jgi:glycosyltransferase involved in cell wall biosynthesis